MDDKITLDREYVECMVDELEEALDLICPYRKNLPITVSVCNACKLHDICYKVHKVAVALNYSL